MKVSWCSQCNEVSSGGNVGSMCEGLSFRSLVYDCSVLYKDHRSLLHAGLKRVHGFSIGDSGEAWKKNKWQEFDSHLQKVFVVFHAKPGYEYYH